MDRHLALQTAEVTQDVALVDIWCGGWCQSGLPRAEAVRTTDSARLWLWKLFQSEGFALAWTPVALWLVLLRFKSPFNFLCPEFKGYP